MDNQELELRALYYKAIEDYRSTEEDKHDEGFLFLKDAADRGMVEACKLLGILYTSGQYDPYPAKDAKRAISYYKTAADAGDEEAMYWLSQCYEMGIGVDKDPEEATLWREMALDHGFVVGEEDLKKAEAAEESDTAGTMTVTEVKVVSVKDQEGDSESETAEEAAKGIAEDKADGAKEASLEEETEEEAEEEVIPPFVEEKEDLPFPTAPEKPKEKTFEEKLKEKEEKEQAIKQKEDREQRNRYMVIAGGLMFGAGLILSLIVFVIVASFLPEKGSGIFWIAALVVSLLLGGLGVFYGIQRAKVKAKKADEYRHTVFYETFGGTFGRLNQHTLWNYKIFRTLEKLYKPASYKKVPELKKKGVGLIYSGWTFKTKRGSAAPDFVILTPKSMYVVDTIGTKGRVMGDLNGYDWTLYTDGGKDGAQMMRKIDNVIEKLKTDIHFVRSSLQLLSPLPIETIPVMGILCVSPETDIKGLRFVGAGNNISVVQGSPDKLRLTMTMTDRSLEAHGIDMEELAKVMDEIGKQQLD